MNQNLIFWPMIVQALVAMLLYFPMGRARIGAVKAGKATAHDFKLPKQNEPQDVAKFGNAVTNQFELPVLFFAVCLATHAASIVDWPMLILAWGFVVTKTTHSLIHITSNKLIYRFRLFVFSLFISIAMWLWFAIGLALESVTPI